MTGASIGSINGALLAQGSFDTAQEAWRSVKMNQIVQMDGPAEVTDNLLDPRNIAMIAKKMITENGLDNTPLKETLTSLLDEDKIRSSPIAYGMTTFSKTGLSTTEVFVEDIPQGQLIDYIMASACFPIFKSVHIGDNEFIDGGIGDNMPFNMLLRRGVKDILAVNIGGVGLVRPVITEDANIIEIKHSLPLGGLFDLAPEVLDFNQKLGKLDTLHTFGQLKGKHYFFSPEEYDRLHSRFSRYTIEGLEEAAMLYNLPQTMLWEAPAFFEALLDAFEQHQPHFEEILSSSALENMIREIKTGGRISDTINGPMRLHMAMEILCTNRMPLWSRGRTGLIMEKERRGALAMLSLIRLGGFPKRLE